MEKVYISFFSALDRVWKIIGSEKGIISIYPTDHTDIAIENQHTILAAKELNEYFVHIRTEFTFPLDLKGSPFRLAVWETLREIPYGEGISYGELAARIGKPGAGRAVGQAVGDNPCLIVVPCHRVLGKTGTLTGFSAGMDLKKQLLKLENIHYSGSTWH